jgi:hypothetical protein
MGLSFSIGRAVESLGGFGIGFCESVYCAAKGTVNTVLHPIQTIQNIPAMIKAMPDIGRQFVDDITSPDAYRNGNAVGRLTGAVSATLVGAKVAEVGGNVVRTNLPKVRDFVGKRSSPNKVFHGNNLNTTKPAQGYTLRNRSNGEILKYGETTLGKGRYTNKFLDENKANMWFEASGTKRQMHTWNHEQILNYKVTHGGMRPPLNKSDW